MGNTCCSGRNRAQKTGENSSELEIENKDLKETAKKKKNLRKSLKPDLKVEIIEDIQQTHLNPQLLEEHSLNYSSESFEEKDSNNEKLKFITHQTEEEGLKYSLDVPEDCSKLQQRQILSVLDRFKDLVPEDEQESVDGLAKIKEKNTQKVVMITTHGIYLLRAEDYSVADRRVLIEDLIGIAISSDLKKAVLQVSQDYYEDLDIESEQALDIVLSIQQVSYEAFEEYLPWVVSETALDKEKWSDLQTKENLRLFKVIIEQGNFPESVVLLEKTESESDSKVFYIMLTDSCIYTLDEGHEFIQKIQLKKIEKIVCNKKNDFVVIYSEGSVNIFSHLSDLGKIKEQAFKVGNSLQILEE